MELTTLPDLMMIEKRFWNEVDQGRRHIPIYEFLIKIPPRAWACMICTQHTFGEILICQKCQKANLSSNDNK